MLTHRGFLMKLTKKIKTTNYENLKTLRKMNQR